MDKKVRGEVVKMEKADVGLKSTEQSKSDYRLIAALEFDWAMLRGAAAVVGRMGQKGERG